MAVKIIDTSGTSAARIQTVTLDDGEYRLRLRWNEQRRAWYMDLYDANDQPLQVGRRLSPGWAPLLGLNRPAGIFVVDGPDDAPDTALGGDVLLLYVEEAP